MSYHKISWKLEAAWLLVWIITLLWKLTGASATLMGACLISERLDNFKHKSHSFETSQDLRIRHNIRYWNGALVICIIRPSISLTSSSRAGPALACNVCTFHLNKNANFIQRNGAKRIYIFMLFHQKKIPHCLCQMMLDEFDTVRNLMLN